MITKKERTRLRELAKRQMELSESERNHRLYKDWELHGRTDACSRPMITVEFGTFCGEFINPLLQCESAEAAELEWFLLHNIFPFENFHDDSIIRNYFPYYDDYYMQPFGLPVRRDESGGLGHHFVSQIHDLTVDFHKLGKSVIHADTNKNTADIAADIFGDILPVKKTGRARYVSYLQDIIHIMDMEDMYVAMLEEPELFHKMCEMLTCDYIELIEKSENDGKLMATNGDVHLCQGSMCFTGDLPFDGENLKTSQIWGYMDAQEAEGISPALFHDLIFPHYKRISERFGLLSFGCCEGVDKFWNDISAFDNLRKLSISAWCNEEYIGEQLQGRKVVYHRKPAPNHIGVDRHLDEDALRASIRKTVQNASGLTLEFSQRDVYTVHCDAKKVSRYVEIIREECEKK